MSLACLALFLSTIGWGQTFEAEYGLGFKLTNRILKGWTYPDRARTVAKMEVDSSHAFLPIKITNATAWGIRMKLKLDLISFRPILLPLLNDDYVSVSISYQCKNLKEAKLFAYSLDADMEAVKTDSIVLRNCDDFRKDSISIDVKIAKSLLLRIFAEGCDSTYERGSGPVGETLPQELSLGGIRLLGGGRDIGSSAFEDVPAPSVERGRCVCLPSDGWLTGGQLASMSGRITALGESVHGSAKINKSTCEFIKSSIVNGKTSMVIMEDPMLMMLFFNRYVQGADDVGPEKLRELLENKVTDIEAMLDLARWIRGHNEKAARKVRFYGNDSYYALGINESWTYLLPYLETINATHHSSVIDSVTRILRRRDQYLVKTTAGKILPILEEHEEALSAILGDDLPVIAFYLENLCDDADQPDIFDHGYDFLHRDKKMFEYTSFLIDNFCPPDQSVVISCHFGHAGYLSSNIPYHKPFGWYMKQKYGGDYVCLAQTVFRDEARAGGSGTVPLAPSSPNSLESALSKTGMDYLYVGSDNLGWIVKKRNKGAESGQQEDYACPLSQFSGVLHVN